MAHEVFLCLGRACNGAFLGAPVILLAQRWSVDIGVLLASEQYIPFFIQLTAS